MIVADASVVVEALTGDGVAGDRARSRFAVERELHAPHLLDLEVLNVWRRQARLGRLSSARARQARSDLGSSV